MDSLEPQGPVVQHPDRAMAPRLPSGLRLPGSGHAALVGPHWTQICLSPRLHPQGPTRVLFWGYHLTSPQRDLPPDSWWFLPRRGNARQAQDPRPQSFSCYLSRHLGIAQLQHRGRGTQTAGRLPQMEARRGQLQRGVPPGLSDPALLYCCQNPGCRPELPVTQRAPDPSTPVPLAVNGEPRPFRVNLYAQRHQCCPPLVRQVLFSAVEGLGWHLRARVRQGSRPPANVKHLPEGGAAWDEAQPD